MRESREVEAAKLLTAGQSTKSSEPPMPKLVDRRTAAKILGVCPNSVDNLRKRGLLSDVQLFNRDPRFDVKEIEALIASRKTRQGGNK